jgi:hypothetical protein
MAPETQVVRKRSKRLIWVAGLVLLASIMALTALARRDPYGFLDKFHPKRVLIDLKDPKFGGVRTSRKSYLTMLKFPLADGPAVLKALQLELDGKKGCDYNLIESGMPYTMMRWTYADRTDSSTPCTVEYVSGKYAGYAASFYEDGDVHPLGRSSKEEPGCLVVYDHEPSWIESQWKNVRNLLHLG